MRRVLEIGEHHRGLRLHRSADEQRLVRGHEVGERGTASATETSVERFSTTPTAPSSS